MHLGDVAILIRRHGRFLQASVLLQEIVDASESSVPAYAREHRAGLRVVSGGNRALRPPSLARFLGVLLRLPLLSTGGEEVIVVGEGSAGLLRRCLEMGAPARLRDPLLPGRLHRDEAVGKERLREAVVVFEGPDCFARPAVAARVRQERLLLLPLLLAHAPELHRDLCHTEAQTVVAIPGQASLRGAQRIRVSRVSNRLSLQSMRRGRVILQR
mmetsp:Transcript_4572/g.18011  ORF Transcript_4572/g.18011 Transcript_4572/m.18011 type:complete len:214 (-) Transcript_4572:963-1604(-)